MNNNMSSSSISTVSSFDRSNRGRIELTLNGYDIDDIYPNNRFLRFVRNTNLPTIEEILNDLPKLRSYAEGFDTTETKLRKVLNQMRTQIRHNNDRQSKFRDLPSDLQSKILVGVGDMFSYRLRDWIDEDKLIGGPERFGIVSLCKNPSIGASELLKSLVDRKKIRPRELYFNMLARQNNGKALKLIDIYCDNIDGTILTDLCDNSHPTAIKLLNKHMPALIELCKKQNVVSSVIRSRLYLNSNPRIAKIIKKIKEATSFEEDYSSISLSTNRRHLELLKKNQDKIDWNNLSQNPSDMAIELLKANQDKIEDTIFMNPNKGAIKLFPEIETLQHLTYVCRNSNSEATELFIKKYQEPRFKRMIDSDIKNTVWHHLGSMNNDAAMIFFRDNMRNIQADADPLFYIIQNPNKIAVELLLKRLNGLGKGSLQKLDFIQKLCMNPSEAVIEELRFHQKLEYTPSQRRGRGEPPTTIDWDDSISIQSSNF